MAGTEQRSILEMSDEEIANLDPASFAEMSVKSPTQEEEEGGENTGSSSGEEDPAADNEAGEGSQAAAAPQGQAKAGEAEPAADNGENDEGSAEAGKGNEESNPNAKSAEPTPSATEKQVDYEAAYKQLTAPFKANGREIQVSSVEDAVSLMQMGANYNKKMSALKPNLRLLKLLETNGLLSEEKLGYLIDLDKKNPEAIGKLIKESGVDPLDLDPSKAGDYKPTRHTVDDRELELDAVLDEIQGTDSYSRTLDVVSNQWDGASKGIIANSPQVLKIINAHVQSGIYDVIAKEVEREKMFGRLSGLSDIEAYRQVGDAIQARGGFDHLVPQGQRTQPSPAVVQPTPKMGDEGKRREKRLAASSSQPAVTSKTAEEFNPLAMSDEEFSKTVKTRFL